MDSVYYDIQKNELLLVRYVLSQSDSFSSHIVLEFLNPFYPISSNNVTDTYIAHYSINKAKMLLSSDNYTFVGYL